MAGLLMLLRRKVLRCPLLVTIPGSEGLLSYDRRAVTELCIDTVGVAIPVSGRGVRAGVRNELGPQNRFRLPGGGFVAVGIGEMAWVEASLPNRCRGENTVGVGLDEARGLIEGMVDEALIFVEPAEAREIETETGIVRMVSVEDPKVVRLDLVRDFRLQEPRHLTPLLDGLAGVPRDGRVKVRRFADGRTGQAETLRVGPASWAASLYDKHVESGGLAERGSLRAEFRLRSRQLTSVSTRERHGAIVNVSDFVEERCEAIRRDWFEKAKFGTWVGGHSSIWDLLRETDLSDREKIFFVGWLQARNDSVVTSISSKTDRRYRRILASIPSISDHLGALRMRLNYELGREEVA